MVEITPFLWLETANAAQGSVCLACAILYPSTRSQGAWHEWPCLAIQATGHRHGDRVGGSPEAPLTVWYPGESCKPSTPKKHPCAAGRTSQTALVPCLCASARLAGLAEVKWSHPQKMPQARLADLRVPPTAPKPSVPTCGKFSDLPALKRLRSVHATAAGFGGREPEADGHNPEAVAPHAKSLASLAPG